MNNLTDDMLAVSVCEKMKWDYYMFQAQPAWFVDLLMKKTMIDSQRRESEFKRRETEMKPKHGSPRHKP